MVMHYIQDYPIFWMLFWLGVTLLVENLLNKPPWQKSKSIYITQLVIRLLIIGIDCWFLYVLGWPWFSGFLFGWYAGYIAFYEPMKRQNEASSRLPH
jgi:hypothetical protein